MEGVSPSPLSQGLRKQHQQGRISSPPSLLKRLPLDAAHRRAQRCRVPSPESQPTLDDGGPAGGRAGGRAPKGPGLHGTGRTQHPSLLLRVTTSATEGKVLLSITKMASHQPTISMLQMWEQTPQHYGRGARI